MNTSHTIPLLIGLIGLSGCGKELPPPPDTTTETTETTPTVETTDTTDTTDTESTDTTDTTEPTETADDTTDPIALDDGGLVPLEMPRLLRRLSLDLRGVLPTIEELDAVEADPEQFAVIREQYLDDERVHDRMLALLNEHFQTRVDKYEFEPVELFDLEDPVSIEFDIERSMSDEPLRLMAHVLVEDLPWTEILTADYTFSNELTSAIWPMDYPEGETGWRKSEWTDGRPGVGILASNGMWTRYLSFDANYNRSRSAVIAELLICEDYLNRPVTLSEATSLVDAEDTEAALRSDPYCMGCHSSLDPIAANLFGFWPSLRQSTDELMTYHPEREPLGPELLGTEMEWYGTPIYGLQELGGAIAADSRFERCTVETFAKLLWRRDVRSADYDRIEMLRRGFAEDGHSAKALIRELTDTPAYRVGSVEADVDPESEQTDRLLSSDLLSSAIEELTGFVWTWDGYDQMSNDTYGYRILAGGINGEHVTRPQEIPGLTWAMVVHRLAQGAAYTGVRLDLGTDIGPGLLTHVDTDSQPGDSEFDAELEDLHWRLYGIRPDANRITELEALWSQLQSRTDATEAWIWLIEVMLRDPEFTTY